MASSFGGVGRPSNAALERQETELKRLIGVGVDLDEAVRQSGIKPERAIAILTPIVQSLLAKAA
jgi:hypothetical protein